MPRTTARVLRILAASALLSIVTSPAVPDVFPSIPEVRAVDGVARVTLDAIVDPVSGYPAFAWNGRLGEAPTIRVRPGETIDLTLRNQMRPFAGRPDDVNVHFHGLTVAPRAPGDDAIGTLAHPGETVHYRVTIPRGHEPGLYWYHPHAHGESYGEVSNGMSGAIVVEGIEAHLPALATMRERVIVLRDVPNGPGFVDDDMPMTGMSGTPNRTATIQRSAAGPPCRPESGLQPTLNRQTDAHIGIRPGEPQFFRIVNAAAARYFDLSVDGAPLDVVARDGFPLDAYPGTPPVQRVTHLVLPPAARVEFVVTPARLPALLRSACVDTGSAGDAAPAVVLAHLVDPDPAAAPDPAATPPSVSLRTAAPLPRNWYAVPLPRPAAARTIRFTEDDHGFYIDGKAFAMDAAPAIVAHSGTVESWTIENATREVHDFHIHQVHFVTTSVGGVAVGPRFWADTVNVPPETPGAGGATVPGRVRIIVDFRDPIVRGTFLFHCHIIDHEDLGMMAKIRVI